MKKPVHHAFRLRDALNLLVELESTLTQVQSSDSFHAFTSRQRVEYHDTLGKLRDLIHDLEQDIAQEQLAS